MLLKIYHPMKINFLCGGTNVENVRNLRKSPHMIVETQEDLDIFKAIFIH